MYHSFTYFQDCLYVTHVCFIVLFSSEYTVHHEHTFITGDQLEKLNTAEFRQTETKLCSSCCGDSIGTEMRHLQVKPNIEYLQCVR